MPKTMFLKFLIPPMNSFNLINLVNTHSMSDMLNAGNTTMNRSVMVSVFLGLKRKTETICQLVTTVWNKYYALTRTGCVQTTPNGAVPRLGKSGKFLQKW